MKMAFGGLKPLVLIITGSIPNKLNGNLKVLNLRPSLRVCNNAEKIIITGPRVRDVLAER